MKNALLCLICTVVLTACGPTSQEKPAAVGSSETPALETDSGIAALGSAPSLSVLGLHLGMDIHDVPGALMEMQAERNLVHLGFTEALQTGGRSQCVLMYTKSYLQAISSRMKERYDPAVAEAKTENELVTACIHGDGVIAAKADSGKQVSSIEFSNIREFFGASEQSPNEFAHQLAIELNLPGLKQVAGEDAWSYTSPHGEYLKLSSKNVLGIPRLSLKLTYQNT